MLSLHTRGSHILGHDKLPPLHHHEVGPAIVPKDPPLSTVVQLVPVLMLNEIPELYLVLSSFLKRCTIIYV